MRSWLGAAALAALGALGCRNGGHTLSIHIVTPLGDDPFGEASTVRVGAGMHSQTVPVMGGHFALSFDVTLDQTELDRVTVDALAADGTLVAHGASPVVQLAPASGILWIYVARPGTLTTPPAENGTGPLLLLPARTRHASVYYPGLGVFLAGGRGPNDGALGDITLFYTYALVETRSSVFALGLARSDLAGALGPDGFLDWVGGLDASGATTNEGEIMDPTGAIGQPYVRATTQPGQPARAQAAAAVGTEGLLLFGGRGPDGMPQPGAVLFTTAGGSQPVSWAGAVPRLGCTATPILGGAQILVMGGGPPGAPVLERYVSQTSASPVSPDPTAHRTGHSATLLDDGTVLWVGGTDDTGRALDSATRFDPTSGQATELPGLLAHARSGHTATRVGGQILVAGGIADGALVVEAEILDAQSLARLSTAPLAVPRVHHTADNPGNDMVVLLGGEDATGVPIGQVEIYQP